MIVDLRSQFWRKLERVEASLGTMMAGVFAGMLALVTLCIIGIIFYKPAAHGVDVGAIAAIGAGVLATLVAGLMFRELKRVFEKNAPHPTYKMSRAFIRRSLAVRVGLGAASLIMAAGILGLGEVWSLMFETIGVKSPAARILVGAIIFIPSLGAAYASNGYLMLFLRSWNFPCAIVKFVYRYRYPLDLTIAFAIITLFESVSRGP